MFRVIILCILLSTFALADDAVHDLSEFDGSTPIIGLFGEPIPGEFFKTNLFNAYKSSENYRSFMQIDQGLERKSFQGLLVNDHDTTNTVVFAAVNLATNENKNFVVMVPPYGEKELDLRPLLEFHQVLILSLIPYRLQLDSAIIQDGEPSYEVSVYSPNERESTSYQTSCGFWNGEENCRVTNYNGPGQNGSVVARFNVYTKSISGPSQTWRMLDVYYPVAGDIRYHQSTNDYPCDPYGSNSVPSDRNKTVSPITYRRISWSGVGNALNGGIGYGTCTYAPSGDTCKVDTDGDGILDAWARWQVERE